MRLSTIYLPPPHKTNAHLHNATQKIGILSEERWERGPRERSVVEAGEGLKDHKLLSASDICQLITDRRNMSLPAANLNTRVETIIHTYVRLVRDAMVKVGGRGFEGEIGNANHNL